jgi:hypothetical protein
VAVVAVVVALLEEMQDQAVAVPVKVAQERLRVLEQLILVAAVAAAGLAMVLQEGLV